MSLTLKPDGSVDQVSTIDGDPLLAEPTVTCVKQWRYKPLIENGKPVLQFVVAITFTKSGHVH